MSPLHSVESGNRPLPPRRPGAASSVRVDAPGKVNLFLSCGAPTADGYHPLTTVFQAVRLIESVTASSQSADDYGRITLRLADADENVPLDERNLAVRAATLLAEHTEVNEGVDLLLRKRVPVAGGMAGGSADAAATLLACNELWGTGLEHSELSALAAQLGADVPFPLTGGNAVGHGRGDLITPMMGRGSYSWVFALQEEGLSTPAVFRRFDELSAAAGSTPQTQSVPEDLAAALRSGNPELLAGALHNDLQPAALSLRPELGDVIAAAEAAGALRAIISGSGPTVAALARDEASALAVASQLEASGTCSRVIRTIGPVAGAKVVG